MAEVTLGTQLYLCFPLLNENDQWTPITSKTNADFTKHLWRDNIPYDYEDLAAPVDLTVSEIGGGRYGGEPVYPTVGTWRLEIRYTAGKEIFVHEIRVIPAVEAAGDKIIVLHTAETENTAISIPGVTVQVWDEENTYQILTTTTNLSGNTPELLLSPGTYLVKLQKIGVTFVNPYTVTILTSGTVVLTGETVTQTTPTAQGYCIIYGYLTELMTKEEGGEQVEEPLVGMVIRAKIKEPQIVGGRSIGRTTKTAVTDAAGRFEVSLAQGVIAFLQIDATRFDLRFRVPYLSSVNFSNLTPL